MGKKGIKVIGNVVSVLSIIFVIYRLYNLEIDYSILYSAKKIGILCILSILYSFNLLINPISWRYIIFSITGKMINLRNTEYVYCKSNLLKYLPGNVFQYIGRNAIAVKERISHLDVAISTCIDIGCNLTGVFFVALLCYGYGLVLWFQQQNFEFFHKAIGLGILILGILGVALGVTNHVHPHMLKNLLKKIKTILSLKNIFIYICCVGAYSLMALYTSELFVLVLNQILNVSITVELWRLLIGTYLISWIVGFITPGAPGGIGVREFAVMLLLKESPFMETVLLGMVIYRLVTIIGDVLAFIWSKLIVSVKLR